MAKWFYLVTALILFSASTVSGDNNQWKLVWQDDFGRAEVGSDWTVTQGKASIIDGRLYMEGGVTMALLSHPSKHDIRFEFDAEANPALPPCDLSVTMSAHAIHGWNYLLAFGGQSNQINQLIGPDVDVKDKNPPFLIEIGKVYHVVAEKEGKRISYTVDGTKILEAMSDNSRSGPGYDRTGFVTWNGMFVDNVKVYERTTPHKDSPIFPLSLKETDLYRDGRQLKIRGEASEQLTKAVDLFNQGKLTEALAAFKAMGPTRNGVIGQAYVMGDLGYQEQQYYQEEIFQNRQKIATGTTPDFVELAEQFHKAVKANPKDKVLADYAWAADKFTRLVMNRCGLIAAVNLTSFGPANNPFYYKAKLYEARYHYWNGAEGGRGSQMDEATSWMAELKTLWPDHKILKQYTGEHIPWGENLVADTERYPAWAAYLREAYARQVATMEHFFAERQTPDGQLGGGYGDDVELMRTWMQIAAISTAAERARAGIQCLADGVWDNELVPGYGYCSGGDIEHAAEPSADTLPTMLLVRYGDPLWVERNLRSCKTIHDMFMGIDAKGYPRFKSSEFGVEEIHTNPRAGGDTGYHARAMKHFIWQGWWGNPEAEDWFVRWCDGWREATMAEIGTKMAGLTPPTIWYPSGEIHPPDADWWTSGWNYYGNMGGMVHDSFLCAYYFTHDPKFLKPLQKVMETATGPMITGDYSYPSKESQLVGELHTADSQKLAIYKMLTGERVYDEYTMRGGDPAQDYRVNYDLDAFMKSSEGTARSLRNNLDRYTTEVLSTDRAALAGALTVFGAYTGAVCGLRDAATPTFSVTYDTPSTDFAALVTEATDTRIRVWLYNFEDKPMRVGLQLWRLKPGEYILNTGETISAQQTIYHRYNWQEPGRVSLTHRADTVYVDVPVGKEWVVDLRLDTPISVPDKAPDMAVNARDLKWTDKGLQVTVHNIGNSNSKPSTAVLQVEIDGQWSTVSEVTLPGISCPKDFSPSTVDVVIPSDKKQITGPCRVALDPDDKEYEICEANNTAGLSN